MAELLEYLTTQVPQFRSTRLGALYSDFRHLRITNPDGYVANIQAWQKGLAEAARAGHISQRGGASATFVLPVDDQLLRSLETKEWGRPLALGSVVREGVSSKELVSLQSFQSSQQSIYNKTWSITPWSLLSWGLRQAGLVGGSDEDNIPMGNYVIMHNLDLAATMFSEKACQFNSKTERVLSRRLFEETYGKLIGGEHPLSALDVEILLQFLARDKGLVAYDEQTVKIKGPFEAKVEISPEDTTIASLRSLMGDLEDQIDVLNSRIDDLRIAALDAVTKKNPVSAKASLRSKKLAETHLSRQTATLGQLEEVWSRIEQAHDQLELVKIMEGSTLVLKKLNTELGGAEKVDDIVYELKEQMTAVDEITGAIREVGQGTDIDEEAVSDELEALELAEKQRTEAALRAKETAQREAEAATVAKRLAAIDHKDNEDVVDLQQSVEDRFKRLSVEEEAAI